MSRSGQPASLLFSQPASEKWAGFPTSGTPAHHTSPGSATPGSRYLNKSRANREGWSSPGTLPDVLPPPPTESLLDPALQPDAFSAYRSPGPAGASQLDRTPGADWSRGAAGRELEQTAPADAGVGNGAAHKLASGIVGGSAEDHDSAWVTVFGFVPEQASLVLRELQQCGTILNYGPFAGGARVNWLHVCFASKHDAQRALLKNGEQLSPTLIIGVKQLDLQQRCSVPEWGGAPEGQLQIPTARGGARIMSSDLGTTTTLASPHHSLVGKISHYILGL